VVDELPEERRSGGVNASRRAKIRPKCCESVDTKRLRAGEACTGAASDPETPPPTATAPAPSPTRFRNARRP
jgi:hypothetical protein